MPGVRPEVTAPESRRSIEKLIRMNKVNSDHAVGMPQKPVPVTERI